MEGAEVPFLMKGGGGGLEVGPKVEISILNKAFRAAGWSSQEHVHHAVSADDAVTQTPLPSPPLPLHSPPVPWLRM